MNKGICVSSVCSTADSPGLFIFLGQEGQLLTNGISIPDYFFEGDAVWQETAISRQGKRPAARFPEYQQGYLAGRKRLFMDDLAFRLLTQIIAGSLRAGIYDRGTRKQTIWKCILG